MSFTCKILLLVLCCFLSYSKSISQAILIKDINTGPAELLEENYYTEFFISCNGFLFFPVTNVLGTEIWKTDGTTEGTSMVIDLNQGSASGAVNYASGFECIAGELFFNGNNGETGNEIYKTDGTREGTVLVKDNNPGQSGSNAFGLINYKNILYYFTAQQQSLKLWKSDGTGEGSVEVTTVESTNGGISITDISSSNTYFYFCTYTFEQDINGYQLWKSDGTEEGTSLVVDSEYSISEILTIGSTCFFSQRFDDGTYLMKTDGTQAGTAPVLNYPIGNIHEFSLLNDKLIFRLNNSYSQLWISDGTEAGTEVLSNTSTNGGRVHDGFFYTVSYDYINGKFFLLRTDGTVQGTENLVELPGYSSNDVSLYHEIAMIGDNFVIPMYDEVLGEEVGITDGTIEGTLFLKDIRPGSSSSSPRAWAELNGSAYFIADDGTHGSEIWKTDGKPEGTRLLVDIKSGTQSSDPTEFQVVNNHLFFLAEDKNYSEDLWEINALEEGEKKHVDWDGVPRSLGSIDTYLYYFHDFSVYKTNVEQTGSILVKDLSFMGYSSFSTRGANYSFGEKLIFSIAIGDAVGSELWITDGTAEGTSIIKDINPGFPSSINYFDGSLLNDKFLFAANDGVHGNELWATDGTEAGTTIIKDLYAGSLASHPRNFTAFGDQVFFSAQEDQNGYRLWKTNGTQEGTTILKELTSETTGSNVSFIAKAGDNLVVAVNDEVDGTVLWKSDGTEDGTVKIKEGLTSISQHHVVVGEYIYFTAADEVNGEELWVSDGTFEGTYSIDITPGIANSSPSNFIAAEGLVYFKANNQLWRSNGTAEYTEMVADVEPINMIYFDEYIYFSMATEEYGTELFKIPFSKYDQNITFEPIPVKMFGDAAFQLVANSSSGLPVTFSSTSANVVLEERMVSLLQAGPASIEAHQEGNSLFNAAAPVIQTFCINPSQPTISVAEEGGTIELVSSSETGNQWFRNGFLLEGNNGQSLVVGEAGSYAVQVNIGDCSSALSTEEHIMITALPEENSANVVLFPNPVSDHLYIQFDASKQPASLEIVDLAGKSHGYFSLGSPLNELSLSHLLPGVYVVKIYYQDRVLLNKLVKE